MHNERLRRLGTTYIYREAVCSQCDGVVVGRGLCRKHYMKFKRTGTMTRLRREPVAGGRTHREKHLLNRYSMTLEQYREMEVAQGGKCAICDEPQRPQSMFVDHDHQDGSIRGLLCRHCNTILGMIESHDDPDRILSGALAYCDANCV